MPRVELASKTQNYSMKSIQSLTAGLLAARSARAATIATTLLVLAGTALFSPPAKAALTYNDGDIFLGFRYAGASKPSYLVDLGSDTQFTLALAGSIHTFGGSSSIGADLVSLYGAGWATDPNLSWGVFGADGTDPLITLFASKARTNVNTPVTPWAALGYNNRSSTQTAINGVENGFITGYTTTALTGNAGSQTITLGASSYYAAVNLSTDFVSSSNWGGTGIEGKSASGIGTTVLDLVQVGRTDSGLAVPSSVLGSFTIDSQGAVSYAAVPEPSTYALVATGGLFGLLKLRRRSSKTEIAN
jgi:hypothetical protein